MNIGVRPKILRIYKERYLYATKFTQIMRRKIRCTVPTCRVQHIENNHRTQ